MSILKTRLVNPVTTGGEFRSLKCMPARKRNYSKTKQNKKIYSFLAFWLGGEFRSLNSLFLFFLFFIFFLSILKTILVDPVTTGGEFRSLDSLYLFFVLLCFFRQFLRLY